jgi:hypothetical protein
MTIARFQLYHINTGESTAVVEFEDGLLGDPKFIDPERMTFPSIPNGGQYTLVPLEDATVAVLTRVLECHKSITSKPCPLPSTMTQRMDELVSVVGLMFGKHEAYDVKGIDDIAAIINPRHDVEPPPMVARTVLGSLLDEVKAKLAEREQKQEQVVASGVL